MQTEPRPICKVGLLSVVALLATESTLLANTSRGDSLRFVSPALLLPSTVVGYEDLLSPPHLHLGFDTRFHYDAKNNLYVLQSYLSGQPLSTLAVYRPQEFMAYVAKRQEKDIYQQLNNHRANSGSYALPQPQSRTSPLWGNGGFKFNLSGTADLGAGLHYTNHKNPQLSERARKNWSFDFDQRINASIQASLGTKLSFGLNYNTDATFSDDGKQARLVYTGGSDDITKLIEVGKVSMSPSNSLLRLSEAMWGIHGKFQLGRLTADILLSQQKGKRRILQAPKGESKQTFEIQASDYDENRHFFLGHFFRSRYEMALSALPNVNREVKITRLEVWISNRRGKYDNARHILSFADLGEPRVIHNNHIQSLPQVQVASSLSNSLYAALQAEPTLRDVNGSTSLLSRQYKESWDFDKEENARKLGQEEYVLNEHLGYISLVSKLRADETLSVAYEYSYQGQLYQVGEFSSDRIDDDSDVLFVKLLKGRSPQANSPYWDLMMRNVYAIGSGNTSLGASGLDLKIYRQSSETGTAIPYLDKGANKGKSYLSVLGLDQVNSQMQVSPDGNFDYIEGATIYPERAWLYFPKLTPFGEALSLAGLPNEYVYGDLYTSTQTKAKEKTEKNRYLLKGTYQGQNKGEIALGSLDVDPSSVRVFSGGQALVEGQDYTLDEALGIVRITNKQLLSVGSPISIELDDDQAYSVQRRAVLGVDLQYELSKSLRLGASALFLGEQSLNNKVRLGQEAMQNTLLGMNLRWQRSLPAIDRLLDRLSLNNPSIPSRIDLNVEAAYLHAGYAKNKRGDGRYSYIDDFENSQNAIELKTASSWYLSSTPYDRLDFGNTLASNYGRAHLSWFTIDPILTREYTSTPSYIRANPSFVSSHYVREIEQREIYPDREGRSGVLNYIPTLNLSYYPKERGAYNFNVSRLGANGYFVDPQNSWAGIMRKIELSDFEVSNIEYLEFWLMDPNLELGNRTRGSLYINLGDISEDILKDGKKSYENGLHLSADGSSTMVENEWGRLPKSSGLGYTFDDELSEREKQDVGLNGLSSIEERSYPSYNTYLSGLNSIVAPDVLNAWQTEQHSPLQDPAGDDFEHYLSPRYDDKAIGVLQRYKYYNGLERNSPLLSSGSSTLSASARPDTEDIDGDNNLNELNRYYEYRVSLASNDLAVGHNYIVASRTTDVKLRSGEVSPVTWYQFRIPINKYTSAIGGISDAHSMRFMRMYLADCEEEVNLRFASLRLVRGDWRSYSDNLGAAAFNGNATLALSSINIEEHSDRKPINYILPPDISRSVASEGIADTEENEQSLSLLVSGLSPGEAKAVYKAVQYDWRRYKTLQLFAHAEAISDAVNTLDSGDLEVFIRFGSDYQADYYEYSSPLEITREGTYNNALASDREAVWPLSNRLDIDLDQLIKLKSERNRGVSLGRASYSDLYSTASSTQSHQRVSVMGNPSLSNIRGIMIGVRNRSSLTQSAEVWLNELRLDNPIAQSSWAINTNVGLQLSDFVDFRLRGYHATSGFGRIDQIISDRQQADITQISVDTDMQLGRLFPERLRLQIPLQVSYHKEKQSPEYSPIDRDIRLSEAIDRQSEEVKKTLQDYSLTKATQRSVSLRGVKSDITSENPMPYDPANISFDFSHSKQEYFSPEYAYQNQLSWLVGLNYDYSPRFKPLHPFSKQRGENSWSRFLKQQAITLWPSNVSLQTSLLRQYEEELHRTPLTSNTTYTVSDIPQSLSFSNQFTWTRKLSLSWSPISNLKLSLNAGTDARIEAPHLQVNRSLNPDDYRLWKEAVLESIRELGSPERYRQQVSANYTLPTSFFRELSWLTATTSYTSTYQWALGAKDYHGAVSMPNMISNQMNLDFTLHGKLRGLYQIFPRLSRIERERAKAVGKQDYSLSLSDRLLSGLMMLRDISLSYKRTTSSYLPSYLNSIGNAFGQRSIDGHLAPGLPFALGVTGEDYIRDIATRGYLSHDTAIAQPAVFTQSKTVEYKATLQPIKDLVITLQGSYFDNKRVEHQYMHPNYPLLKGGDLQMTTIGLKGLFEPVSGQDGYRSSVYQAFLDKRESNLKELWNSLQAHGSSMEVGENSPIVLLAAFRDAYLQGKQPIERALPTLGAMLPNWSITYTGLSKISKINELFRSISLRHTYRGIYRINSYNSFVKWEALPDSPLGYTKDHFGQNKLSYQQDISSVSLSESFYPLIGADAVLKNGLNLGLQWRKSRTMSLALSTARLVETNSNEWNVSLSYRLADVLSLFSPSRGRLRGKRGEARLNGLTIKADYSAARSYSLIRQITLGATQATLGQGHNRFSLSLDYELSRAFTLQGYYELNTTMPIVSSGAYPLTERRYGVSLKLNLSR